MSIAERLLSRLYARFLAVFFTVLKKDVEIASKSYIHPKAKIVPGEGKIIIGEGVYIHQGAMLLAYDGKIVIGNNVSVNPYSLLYGHGGLSVGDNTRIAAHVVIIPADHKFDQRDRPIYKQGEKRQGITIKNDVWIGAGAKVLDGSYISKGCVIGANAVVKTKTEAYGVYAGCPANKIKSR